MCKCETNLAAAGRAIAGGVLGHFSSMSDRYVAPDGKRAPAGDG